MEATDQRASRVIESGRQLGDLGETGRIVLYMAVRSKIPPLGIGLDDLMKRRLQLQSDGVRHDVA